MRISSWLLHHRCALLIETVIQVLSKSSCALLDAPIPCQAVTQVTLESKMQVVAT
jgi:hypothetical protein